MDEERLLQGHLYGVNATPPSLFWDNVTPPPAPEVYQFQQQQYSAGSEHLIPYRCPHKKSHEPHETSRGDRRKRHDTHDESGRNRGRSDHPNRDSSGGRGRQRATHENPRGRHEIPNHIEPQNSGVQKRRAHKCWLGVEIRKELLTSLNTAAAITRNRASYTMKTPHMSLGWCIVTEKFYETQLRGSLESQLQHLVQTMASTFTLQFSHYSIMGKEKNKVTAVFEPVSFSGQSAEEQYLYLNNEIHNIFRDALMKYAKAKKISLKKVQFKQPFDNGQQDRPLEEGFIAGYGYVYRMKIVKPIFHVTLGRSTTIPKNLPSTLENQKINASSTYTSLGAQFFL
jgi:hypothetical protein